MTNIILGNVFSGLSVVSDLYSISKKTAKGVLLVQTFTMLLYILSTLCFNAYSAVVQNVFGMIRNIFAIKKYNSKILQVALVVLPAIIGVMVNNQAFIGLLPVIANLEYSVGIFLFRDKVIPLKLALLANYAMFAVFNFAVQNYVGFVNSNILMIYDIIAIVKAVKSKNNPSESETEKA